MVWNSNEWKPTGDRAAEAKPSTGGIRGTTRQHMTYVRRSVISHRRYVPNCWKKATPVSQTETPLLAEQRRWARRLGLVRRPTYFHVWVPLCPLPQILTPTRQSAHLFPMTQSHWESYLAKTEFCPPLQKNQSPELDVLEHTPPNGKYRKPVKVLFKTN